MNKILITILLLITTAAIAEPLQLESGAGQVSVIELFTSEGCSSCPPADRWLSGLKNHEGLWNDFVPLAFHVDYWDYIGWKDRFASLTYSQRQRRYESEGSLRTVYTPGFLVNGNEWRGWFGRRAMDFSADETPGVLRAVVGGDEIKVAFEPSVGAASAATSRELRVTVALLGAGLKTEVRAGENRGRTLSHDFVVLGLEQAKLHDDGSDLHTAVLRLPDSNIEAERYALAVWISSGNRQAPIQATGGWLNLNP
ncbi:MAG: DUF1223 domain-containing protein [Gammaproteobacteria bacterium]|nr:DUF1223 domain-containing protein [Gammaproteobacteria bacterium]